MSSSRVLVELKSWYINTLMEDNAPENEREGMKLEYISVKKRKVDNYIYIW